jgi:hypothetical protein
MANLIVVHGAPEASEGKRTDSIKVRAKHQEVMKQGGINEDMNYEI